MKSILDILKQNKIISKVRKDFYTTYIQRNIEIMEEIVNKPIILGATKTKEYIDMLKVMGEQMRKVPKKIMTIYQYHIKTQRIVAVERISNEKFWDETKKEFQTLINQGKYEIDNEYDLNNSTIYAIVDTKDGKGKYIVAYNIGSIDNAKRLIEESLK